MPAFESRRVRTQPLTVTAASCGALPARTARTSNTLLAMYGTPILDDSLLKSADARADMGDGFDLHLQRRLGQRRHLHQGAGREVAGEELAARAPDLLALA